MNREHRKENKIKFEKALRKKGRDKDKVWQAIRDLGWEELDKPIRWGYEKIFVLRKDITKRDDVKQIQILLDMVNAGIISRDKKFLYKNWKTKKMEPMKHELDYISHKEYNKLTRKQQLHFKEVYKKDWRDIYSLVGFELTLPDYYFVEKIQPYYVTRVLKTDPELQSEYDRIVQEIDHSGLWGKLDSLFGVNNNDSWFTPHRIALEIEIAKSFKHERSEIMKEQ